MPPILAQMVPDLLIQKLLVILARDVAEEIQDNNKHTILGFFRLSLLNSALLGHLGDKTSRQNAKTTTNRCHLENNANHGLNEIVDKSILDAIGGYSDQQVEHRNSTDDQLKKASRDSNQEVF